MLQAIARALYAKPEIALFDDVFSGLDMNTRTTVFHNLFGPQGILKQQGTTTVLVTHAGKPSRHSPLPAFHDLLMGANCFSCRSLD